jgi:hypothetical protein
MWILNHARYSPHSHILHLDRKKVKFTLEQAIKSQWMPLPSNLGVCCGWLVNAMQQPLYPKNDPVPIVREDGWAPGLVCIGAKYLAVTGIQFLDCPPHSESLY